MGDKKFPGIAAEDIGGCAYGIFKAGREYIGKTRGHRRRAPDRARRWPPRSRRRSASEVRYNEVDAGGLSRLRVSRRRRSGQHVPVQARLRGRFLRRARPRVLARAESRAADLRARGSPQTRAASRSSSSTLWREGSRKCLDFCSPPPLSGAAASAASSWVLQTSPVTERLRGVSAVGEKVAWASGNKGTVVRTVDGGATWTARAAAGGRRARLPRHRSVRREHRPTC